MEFTVSEAEAYAQEGRLEEWVHLFLLGPGHNPAFSQGLKLQPRYWAGPLQIDLDLLEPSAGPEPEREYQIPPGNWERDMEFFTQRLQDGWQPPPLLAQLKDSRLSLRDGNHRHGALRRAGFDSYWVIIWSDCPQALSHLKSTEIKIS